MIAGPAGCPTLSSSLIGPGGSSNYSYEVEMTDANPFGFTVHPPRLRRMRCFVNAGNRIMRLATIPLGLIGLGIIVAKYKHMGPSIDPAIAPIVVNLFACLGLVSVAFIFALFSMDQVVKFSLIRCPRCGKAFFDSSNTDPDYPQCCSHCGLDIGPCT